MDKENGLYELTKQLTALQHLRDKQQQSLKIKSKLELRDIIRECFKTFSDIVAIPPTFCDNAVAKEGNEEPYLEIERKNASHLQDLKGKIYELIVAEEMQINEAKLPDNLEECVEDFRIEIQEQGEQLKLYTCLTNNFDAILVDNFCNKTQISGEEQIMLKVECDVTKKQHSI